jgi:hypothetical protein
MKSILIAIGLFSLPFIINEIKLMHDRIEFDKVFELAASKITKYGVTYKEFDEWIHLSQDDEGKISVSSDDDDLREIAREIKETR